MALLATVVDQYNRTTVGTGYTVGGAGASIIGNALAIPANYAGGVVYSNAKTTGGHTLDGSTMTVEVTQTPARSTTSSANAQVWVEINTGAVNRVGFEIVAPVTAAGAVRIDFLGQTTGYAAIGTTQSLAWDPVAMRWLRLRLNATALYWETAPDGLT